MTMTDPTPRQVYDWLAPIRDKCPEALPSYIRASDARSNEWVCGGPLCDWLPPSIAHDLITLHMLRWLCPEQVSDIMGDELTLRGAAVTVANCLGVKLAPWPGDNT